MALLDDSDEPTGLAGEIAKNYEEARKHWNGWRDEARLCYQFYANDQWDTDDLAFLKEQGRPAITFNRITPLVDAVLGHEANNRTEVRYIPRTMGDAKVSEMLTEAAKYFRDTSRADIEEADAFRDCIVTGMGCTQIILRDDENPEYDLALERVDVLEILPDPRARKPNLMDAKWVVREKRMTSDEISSIWPDAEPGPDPVWVNRSTANDSGNPRNRYNPNDAEEADRKGHLVIEYQYRDTEVFYVVTHPATGEKEVIDADTYTDRKKDIQEAGLECEMKRRYTWRRAFMIGNEIVQHDAPSPKHCTYTFITGKRDYEAGTWFGIVKSLLDPQRMLNKWLSQMTNIVNSNSQGGVMVERGALGMSGTDEFENKWADPRGVIVLEDGALQKNMIQPKPAPTYPQGVHALYQLAEQAFMQVSGINPEMMGLADREQAGVLEWQRKQSAVSMLAPLFDSFKNYRRLSGSTFLWFMRTYISDGRMIRIVRDEPDQIQAPMPDPNNPGAPPQNTQVQLQPGDNYIPMWRDPAVSDYDVKVDQGASAPNQKEQTWGVLTQLFPALKGMLNPEVMLLFMEYSPLPETLVAKMKAMAAAQKAQGPPPDPKMLEAQAGIEADKAKMQADLQMKQQSQQMDMQLAQTKLQAEIEMKKAELAAKLDMARAEAEAQMLIERQKAMMDYQVKIQGAQMQAAGQEQATAIQAEVDLAKQGREHESARMQEQAAFERDEATRAAEMERDERIRSAEQQRTEAMAQFMASMNERMTAMMGELSGAVKELAEAQMAETKLEKNPDGTKTVRKVKRQRKD